MQDQSESSFFQVESIHHDEAVEQLELQVGSRQHQFYKVCHYGFFRYDFFRSRCKITINSEYSKHFIGIFCKITVNSEYGNPFM